MKIFGDNIPLSEIQRRRDAGELPIPGGGGAAPIDNEKIEDHEKRIQEIEYSVNLITGAEAIEE